MRKILLTVAALAAFGIALPVATSSANAATVVIKKDHRDNGWNHRHHRNHVVVRDHRHHGARVGVGVGTTGAGIVVR